MGTEPNTKLAREAGMEMEGKPVKIDSQMRMAEVCPIDAAVPDPEHVESREELLAKWHRLHPGETPTLT